MGLELVPQVPIPGGPLPNHKILSMQLKPSESVSSSEGGNEPSVLLRDCVDERQCVANATLLGTQSAPNKCTDDRNTPIATVHLYGSDWLLGITALEGGDSLKQRGLGGPSSHTYGKNWLAMQ